MMSYFVTLVVKAFCFVVSAAFIFTIIVAQSFCSQIPSLGHQCTGQDGNIWMAPVILSPIGVPALIASILILVRPRR